VPESMADAMIRLARNPKLRCELGEAGRRRASTQFSLQTMVRRYEALYVDLMERRRPVRCRRS